MNSLFKPASKLTPAQILGDCTSGEVWLPWRVDCFGEPWYRRHDATTTVTPEVTAGKANLCGVPKDAQLVGTPKLIAQAEFI
jgi:hypothetical protein